MRRGGADTSTSVRDAGQYGLLLEVSHGNVVSPGSGLCQTAITNLTARIPGDLARRLAGAGGGIERMALQAVALEECRAGRLSKKELRQTLGFEALDELDGYLKQHGVFEPYTLADLTGSASDAACWSSSLPPSRFTIRC